MLLAIDTATRIMSLAVHDGNALLAEQSWSTRNRHTVELAPAVQAMFNSLEISAADLTGLAVSIGPGSYTGLRIGVAFAKGLAASQNLPLVGVTTLDTLAAGQPHHQSGMGLVAVVQAGRGRIIVQSYRWSKKHWSSRVEPRLMDWATLLNTIDGPAYITGEVDQNGRDAIAEAEHTDLKIAVIPPAHRLRRAGFLAELAWERLTALDDESDPATMFAATHILPIYLQTTPEK